MWLGAAMEGGLKSGNHITILLCICYGAVDTQKTEESFAHKLAREFATHGISTTIIASENPVHRFGSQVILADKIMFSNRVGMEPGTTFKFSTKVDGPNEAPQIEVSKITGTIQLSKTGLSFLEPQVPQVPQVPQELKPALSGGQKIEASKVPNATTPLPQTVEPQAFEFQAREKEDETLRKTYLLNAFSLDPQLRELFSGD